MNKETKKVRKGGKRKYIGKPISERIFKIELEDRIGISCRIFRIMIGTALNNYLGTCMKSQREPDTSEFLEFLEEFEEDMHRESKGFDNFCENLKIDSVDEDGLYVEES